MAENKTRFNWINKAKILKLFGRVRKGLMKEISDATLEVMLVDVLPRARRTINRNFRNKSGNLSRALDVDVKTKRNKIIASIFADLKLAPYARAHEFGAVIRPKKAKDLWIPIFGTKGSPRRKKGLIIVTRKRDKQRFAGMVVGKEFRAMYVLKQRVDIPQRAYMTPALRWGAPRIGKAIKKISEKSFK